MRPVMPGDMYVDTLNECVYVVVSVYKDPMIYPTTFTGCRIFHTKFPGILPIISATHLTSRWCKLISSGDA